jgi:trk system potassium uptake protein TrkH
VIVMMFVGRVGPLTLAVAVARTGARARVRYPEGRILVG